MKVSIITPSYNQAAFLEQTIRSVLDQGYSDLEYLLVDGASTDGSLEIIQKYSKQLTWWVSEPDSGQAEAINKGLSSVSGDIVAWLNSDDILLPGAIKQAVSIFTQFPETGLIYGDVLAIDARGTTTNRLTYSDMSLSDLAAFQMIGQPSVFMRRSVLEKAGYLDVSFHFLLDHHLWLRMAQLANYPSYSRISLCRTLSCGFQKCIPGSGIWTGGFSYTRLDGDSTHLGGHPPYRSQSHKSGCTSFKRVLSIGWW